MKPKFIITCSACKDGVKPNPIIHFLKRFDTEAEAKAWGLEKATLRYPKKESWQDHWAAATSVTDASINTKAADDGTLETCNLLIFNTGANASITIEGKKSVDTTAALQTIPKGNREEVIELALKLQTDDKPTPETKIDESNENKPEQLEALAYSWWGDNREKVISAYSGWFGFPPSHQPLLVIEKFMLDEDVQIFCREIYGKEADIRRHALAAFSKYCLEKASS